MILITGGLGYIGSHICVELLNNNYNIIIVDNLSNSNIDVYNKIKLLTDKNPKLYIIDLLDFDELKKVFNKHIITSIIHCAGLKAVGESINNPLNYYDTNINSTINLLKLCSKYKVKQFIFSSSATVYGNNYYPVDEHSSIGSGITNPYGYTKLFIEQILNDYSKINDIKIISLRYFNPVGCHSSGLIGENPNGIPNNLMPYILKVCIKNNFNNELDDCYNELKIFGNDYDTIDGTCIRDFIHVVDLANAHLKALEYFNNMDINYDIFNIGTGKGTSVLELIETFKDINKVVIPYRIIDRREGDLECVYCRCDKANKLLNWYSKKSLEDICIDSLTFCKNNI